MTKLEKFLSTSIEDHKSFASALNSAVKEIRAEELNMDFFDFTFNGDRQSEISLNEHSIYPLDAFKQSFNLKSIPQHLNNVTQSWENTAFVYRGTRLPNNNSSFGLDGIHTTPNLNFANAYATGTTNNSTGIGRLLKHIEAGFISSYAVPLSTNTYNNFEFEDIQKLGIEKILPTLQDLKDSSISLSQNHQTEFYLDNNDIPSPILKAYYSLVHNNSHYETILPQDTPVHSTYFRSNTSLIEINHNNPKWDMILARIQEASFRDFYEIIPLEKLLQQTSYIKETDDNKMLLKRTKEIILETKEKLINSPWECKTMADINLSTSSYIEKRPYIKNSRCVGSAMETCYIEKPESIKKLDMIVEFIRTNDLVAAGNLLEQFQPSITKNLVTSSNLMSQINAVRKTYQPEEKKISSQLNFK